MVPLVRRTFQDLSTLEVFPEKFLQAARGQGGRILVVPRYTRHPVQVIGI